MDLLQFFSAFHELDQQDYELLLSKLQAVKFNKGDLIIREGQVQKKLFIINKGLLMSYLLHEGRQHVVAFVYHPGIAAVPESFFRQQPSASFLQCLSDVECDCLAYADLQLLFDSSREIERLFRKMTETVLAGLMRRYNELHTLTIEERFKAFTSRSPHLLQMVPHKYLASYLRIDSTNFSKLYNSVRL
jgi:CRP-like cAMP-binding protein